jgi:hypothetical protein
MPRTGLLDEEIFAPEIFTVKDHQLVYDSESMPNSAESNVVVKLPQKPCVLRRDVDSNREKKFLRYDRQAFPKAHCQLLPKHKVQNKT